MSDESIKVTDKRMFTADGELREEYRFLEERASRPPDPPEPEAPAPPTDAPLGSLGEPEPELAAESGAGPGPAERPVDGFPEAGADAPGFFDLLGVLAEPIPFYLGDAPLPGGEAQENLEAARFYIDLLDTLREKTAGNLTAQETAALEDVLYRLRVRYVQKRR